MKLVNEWKPPPLARWVKDHLPASLVMCVSPCGYGVWYEIYRKGEEPKLFRRTDPIAEIDGDSIRLFHPNYFADMEDLLRRYEAEFKGVQTTLRYSDSNEKRKV